MACLGLKRPGICPNFALRILLPGAVARLQALFGVIADMRQGLSAGNPDTDRDVHGPHDLGQHVLAELGKASRNAGEIGEAPITRIDPCSRHCRLDQQHEPRRSCRHTPRCQGAYLSRGSKAPHLHARFSFVRLGDKAVVGGVQHRGWNLGEIR